MPMTYTPEPLPFDATTGFAKGLSEKALAIHHDKLYVGYVNKRNELEQLFPSIDLATATNATSSPWRAAKLEETFAVNGVVLHEAYFRALAGTGGQPSGALAVAIARDFGSMERWLAEFVACGMSARGWVVLAWDMNDNRLHNYICDAHNHGGIWGAAPLLVLDVYEHAYFIDYGSDRKAYIADFMAQINWESVSAQYSKMSQ